MLLSFFLLQAGIQLATLGKALAAAIAAFAAAFGISRVGKYTLEAGARQPERVNDFRMTAIIISALIEGACLFAILVALIVK